MSENDIIINVTKITPISKPLRPSPWQAYMVRCSDGSLYTGVTTGIPRRIYETQQQHKKRLQVLQEPQTSRVGLPAGRL